MRRPNAKRTRDPVKIPPKVVRTPLVLFTAVRVKEPVVGIEDTKEPRMLQRPKAIISWFASIVFPLAANKRSRS